MSKKYSLLIIDDEKLIREGLVDYLDWDALGIRVIGTACDGAQAVGLIERHRPDIILSDISMPNMDGTQLIRHLREREIRGEVIFMSAYSEFKYAQSAVRYDAFDYLLKPISEEVLRACMTKCVEKLSRRGQSDDSPSLEDVLAAYYQGPARPFDRRLRELFAESVGQPPEETPLTLLAAVRMRESEPVDLREFLAGCAPLAVFISEVGQSCVAALICGGRTGDEAFSQRLEEVGRRCPYVLFGRRGIDIRRETLHDAFIRSCYQIVRSTCPTDIRPRPLTDETYAAYVHEQLTCCMRQDPDALDRLLYSFWDYQYQNKTLFCFNQFLYQCISLIYAAYNVIDEHCQSLFDTPRSASNDLVKRISGTDSVAGAFFALYWCLSDSITSVSLTVGKSRIARQALCYIHEHYSSEITLGLLAERLNVSKSYLSRLFKENFGVSFSDYVLSYRMGIAQKLLTKGDCKVYEAAAAVGYQDVVQFTKMFKKIVGCPPRQCGKRNLFKDPPAR